MEEVEEEIQPFSNAIFKSNAKKAKRLDGRCRWCAIDLVLGDVFVCSFAVTLMARLMGMCVACHSNTHAHNLRNNHG